MNDKNYLEHYFNDKAESQAQRIVFWGMETMVVASVATYLITH